jgi:hypothetical protein
MTRHGYTKEADHGSGTVHALAERHLESLKYLAKPRGGAVAQIPVEDGRAIAAVFTPPPHGRATPIKRRLWNEGRCLIERRRLPTDPHTGGYMIGVCEQLEGFLMEAFIRRTFRHGDRMVKRSLNTYDPPAVEFPTGAPAG